MYSLTFFKDSKDGNKGRIEQVTFPLSRMDNTEDDGGGRKPALGEKVAVDSVLIGGLELVLTGY